MGVEGGVDGVVIVILPGVVLNIGVCHRDIAWRKLSNCHRFFFICYFHFLYDCFPLSKFVTWPIVVCPIEIVEVFPNCVFAALFALLASSYCAEADDGDHKKSSSNSPDDDGVLEVIVGEEGEERSCVQCCARIHIEAVIDTLRLFSVRFLCACMM